jgi:cation diffusion facilitator CzcD-associated flavoprotein CzcO
MSTELPDHVRIAIVGSGFSGLGMAIKLREAGIHDFVVLERDADIGGTWRDNTYPGCQCDVPSNLYSFSFAPNPSWTRTFPLQPEIQAYLRAVAGRFGIRPYVRFGQELTAAQWDEDERVWRVEASGGTFTAKFLISAIGGLSTPSLPGIPGLDGFQGTKFHSARWNHEHDLAGERVAVIGTGASAIQFVPRIQPEVARLKVFQRTPPWIMPHRDRPTTRFERLLFRRVPAAQKLVREAVYWGRETYALGFLHKRFAKPPEAIARRHLERSVPDPELREKLTPAYTIGCKRILPSNDYLPTLTKPNVELLTDAISEVREHAIVTADGTEHEVDTIILGTGFLATDVPLAKHIRGADGRSLDEMWDGSFEAYLGTTMTNAPNLFWLFGPNTGLGHTSILVMLEAQIGYVMQALRAIECHGIDRIETRPEVQRAYNEKLQRELQGTVWNSGGCSSYYLDRNGRNSTIWPGFTFAFRRRTASFDLGDYDVRAPDPAPRELTPV